MRTTRTNSNIGRRFYGCSRYGENGACNFFKWFDMPIYDQICGHVREITHELPEKLQECQDELASSKWKVENSEFELTKAMNLVKKNEEEICIVKSVVEVIIKQKTKLICMLVMNLVIFILIVGFVMKCSKYNENEMGVRKLCLARNTFCCFNSFLCNVS